VPQEIAEIMLHRPPMLLIDELISYDETRATARTTFSHERYGAENGFTSEPALIECMAQTVAAQRGQLAYDKGISPQPGMLVGVQNTEFHRPAEVDIPLNIDIEITHKLDNLYLVDCEITHRSERIVSGSLKFYAPEDTE